MMNLCDINEVKSLLGEKGFRFSKSMGQNFLIDESVPRNIVERSGINKTCGVLEIGPGIGCLTQRLSEAAEKVVAVELDKALLPLLGVTLAGIENIEIVNADALKLDIVSFTAEKLGGLRPQVCANIPYNITTPLLSVLIDARCFESITVMIQREVADRICARPGTAAYGAFTVYTNYYTVPEKLFDVSPESFTPRPKVWSSVISLKKRPNLPLDAADEKLFFKIVRASFAQRRKTLANGLFAAFSADFSKEKLTEMLISCGFKENIRGETLDIAGFMSLTEAFKRGYSDIL